MFHVERFDKKERAEKMNDKERKNLELLYHDRTIHRSGAAVIGDHKVNQLYIRVIDKTGEVRLIESLDVLLRADLREKVEFLDSWVIQVGGTEKFKLVNLNESEG